MSEGRTFWWAKDAAWYDRESVVILGHEFGAEGPAVLDVLNCQAKLENDGGRIKAGYQSLTKKGNIHSGESTTRKIVARAVELGALDDFVEDRLTFRARVSGWKADQDLARAAVRQDRHRQATAADQVRDPALRTVTGRDGPSPTEQNRTEQHKQQTSTVEPRLDGEDAAITRLFDHWQAACRHSAAKLTKERRAKLRARLREGYTVDQIEQGIAGAARNPPTTDGVAHDDLVSICRNGAQLERYIGRAGTTAVVRNGSVHDQARARRAQALAEADGRFG